MLKSVLAACALLCAFTINADAKLRHQASVPAIAKECNVIMPCDLSYGSPAQLKETVRVTRGKYIARQVGLGSVAPKPKSRSLGAVVREVAGNIRQMVDVAASAAGVPSMIAHAVIQQESKYNPSLRGRAGEYGIGQIKCQTARSVGFSGSCGQLLDAATNLTFSMRYLRLALDRGGAGCAGVSLYQRGIYGRASCSGYGRQVMARAGQ